MIAVSVGPRRLGMCPTLLAACAPRCGVVTYPGLDLRVFQELDECPQGGDSLVTSSNDRNIPASVTSSFGLTRPDDRSGNERECSLVDLGRAYNAEIGSKAALETTESAPENLEGGTSAQKDEWVIYCNPTE